MSPVSIIELLLLSVVDAVLVTSIDGVAVIDIIVGSFSAEVLGSSLRSVTLLFAPGLVAVAVTLFSKLPLSTACWSIR